MAIDPFIPFIHSAEGNAGTAATPAPQSPTLHPEDAGARQRASRPSVQALQAASLQPLDPLDMLPPMGADLPLEIAHGEVHLWYVFSDEVRDPALLAAYERLLAPEERVQWQRFVFERDRHQYLVTRALVRTVLSRYSPVAPAEWSFVRNAYGKPEVCGPPRVFWPRFNLSHTRGLIVCAVSASHQTLGVDVEDTSRSGETVSLAEHFFSPDEVRSLRALPAAAQRQRFFAYWTLKEAYIKARGMGLSIPLDQFSLQLDARGGQGAQGGPIRISFDARLEDQPALWQFVLLRASARHFLALGVRAPDAALCLRAVRCVPLQAARAVSGHGRSSP